MNKVLNIIDSIIIAYDAFVARQNKKLEKLNYIVDFEELSESSDKSAYAYIWIEPKNIIHYRSKAKPLDLIEVKCLLFDFCFKIEEDKLIIKAIGHFNPEKFNGRNFAILRPKTGEITLSGYDKITAVEMSSDPSLEVISKNIEDLFEKCYRYYFNGRINEELVIEFGLTNNEADTFLAIINKMNYDQETATYVNDQFDAAIPFEGGMTPSEAVVNLIERIKENP